MPTFRLAEVGDINDRKSLFRHSSEKVRNCRERPPRARLRGPPATTGAANRPGLMLLSRQFSITAYYVKSESAAAQEGRVHKGGAFDVQLRHEGTNITGERVVNRYTTQLNDALIESCAVDPGFSHKENGGLPGPPALPRNTDLSVNVVY